MSMADDLWQKMREIEAADLDAENMVKHLKKALKKARRHQAVVKKRLRAIDKAMEAIAELGKLDDA